MDKNEIFEFVIREMTETALLNRRETCAEEEQQLYKETGALSRQRQEDCQVLEDYFVKTNLIADHECRHLYVQGAKDCVELLKKLGVL